MIYLLFLVISLASGECFAADFTKIDDTTFLKTETIQTTHDIRNLKDRCDALQSIEKELERIDQIEQQESLGRIDKAKADFNACQTDISEAEKIGVTLK